MTKLHLCFAHSACVCFVGSSLGAQIPELEALMASARSGLALTAAARALSKRDRNAHSVRARPVSVLKRQGVDFAAFLAFFNLG
jgi:hypothetical protein